jgi:hypothetical protein
MATIKFGASISDARGSVGGTVFSRNTGGAYTRQRVAPINRNTPKQTVVRQNFAGNSKMWSATLTADQRQAWTLFAQANPVPNRLGDSIILSGLAMFNGLNQTLSQILAPPVLDAPSDLSVPTLASVNNVLADSSVPEINLVTEAQTVVTGAKYYIEATGALAAGRTPPTSGYRYMEAKAAVAAGIAVDFTEFWTAAFGTLPANASIGVRVSTVNTNTGARTPAQVFWITST